MALFDRGGGGAVSSRAGAGVVPRAVLVSRGLPALGQFPSLSVAGGHLMVSDGYGESFRDGRVTGTCVAATVDPVTLRVVSLARGSCGDPALFGERVTPVVYVPTERAPPGWGTNPLAMRIATVDPASADGYKLGPVIVTYPDCSDCRAETIYGAGSLWVYAPMTDPRSESGELLRVSETTGRVVERWRMPQILRALLASDADGLWIAPSIESGWPLHATAAQKVAEASLYRVAAGMRTPQRTFDVGGSGARWLAADDHTVWLDVGPLTRSSGPALWRFDGPAARATIRGTPIPGSAGACGDLGEGSVTVLGAATGVYCVNTAANSQRVSWLEPDGHRGAVVASVPTPIRWDFADNAVTYNGSYYFIDPPTTAIFASTGGSPRGNTGPQRGNDLPRSAEHMSRTQPKTRALRWNAVDRSDPTLLHEQVAAEIRRAIRNGEARPGERIPQARDLAAVLGVNANTVLRALRLLREEGLIQMGRGRAITVTSTPDKGAVIAKARELVELARRHGYRPDELMAMIERAR